MSISSEISRITTDRNNIRAKLVDMSLATSTDDLDALTEAIQGISNQGAKTASLDASNTSYTIPQGYHNGNGRVSVSTQTKSATPSTSAQTVTPDSGKLLSSVTIDAMNLQNKTVTPTSSQQIITADSGYDGLDEVTVEAGGTVHTDTYNPAVNTSANDMGASHKYRYVNTSGMIKPSGTKSASYTTNGTSTVDVKNYENISITRNISASLSRTKLWENSSPTSNFNAQPVTLSQSIANFTYIEFEYRGLVNVSTQGSLIIPVSNLRAASSGANKMKLYLTYRATTSYARLAEYVSDTQIQFAASSVVSGTGSNTNTCIPLYIYGLK